MNVHCFINKESYCDKALFSAINTLTKARGQRQLACPLDDSYFIDNGVSKINFEEIEEKND